MHELPGDPICLDEYEGRSGRTPLPFNLRLVPRHDDVIKLAEQSSEVVLKF